MSVSYQGWLDGIPPQHWKRVLAMDVGGASPNNITLAAQCPDSLSIVAYAEVNKITTDMREMAVLALPLLKYPGAQNEYDFIAKVGDYENRIALDDMARHGIRFTNAVKHDKLLSVHRLAGYLHPNPKRPFPQWHPLAGQLGAPLLFLTLACKHAISELPQQKWKKADRTGTSMKDELDRTVRHDAVDCLLYISRIMPAPSTIPVPKLQIISDTRSLQSKLYWADVKAQKERLSQTEARRAYNPAHTSGGLLCTSLLSSLPSRP